MADSFNFFFSVHNDGKFQFDLAAENVSDGGSVTLRAPTPGPQPPWLHELGLPAGALVTAPKAGL
jgi:hypothetical protein